MVVSMTAATRAVFLDDRESLLRDPSGFCCHVGCIQGSAWAWREFMTLAVHVHIATAHASVVVDRHVQFCD